jgi:formate dehydrogenase
MSEDKFNIDFKSNTSTEDQTLLKKILAPLDFRRDLLIEHLHKIQDHFGYLSEKNLSLLAKILKLSKVEVYEVASFYAHFDIVKE